MTLNQKQKHNIIVTIITGTAYCIHISSTKKNSIHSSILVLPCLYCRSETGTTRVMTSGLTGDHLLVYVLNPKP